MSIQIKICGLSTPETLDAAIGAGATHVGLVRFAKSPRHVSLEEAAALRERVPGSVKAVLLMVDPGPDEAKQAIEAIRPDVIQLHGSETPEKARSVRDKFGIEVWKALGVEGEASLDSAQTYHGSIDRILYDAPASELPGGNGEAFGWDILKDYHHTLPWGLAGGLDPSNVAQAIEQTGTELVDVSSGVESAPGIKDVDKIAAFCKAARRL